MSQTAQDVVVEVENVVFAARGINVAPGRRLTVVMQPKRSSIRTPCGSVIEDADVNGLFDVGERVVALVEQARGHPGPNGVRTDVWMLTWDWQSLWRVEGAHARSVDPHRSAPMRALVRWLVLARQAGRTSPASLLC